jgi:glycogen(starch) synthase
MRIAYLTQEFTPLIGGIGSYVHEVARAMARRGHSVEVFTVHDLPSESTWMEGFLLHRLHWQREQISLADRFAEAVLNRHREQNFDVLESPEYLAQASAIRVRLPDLPLVVKLHTSTMLTGELNGWCPALWDRIRFRLGCWRRGQPYRPPWESYDPLRDPERELTCQADLVVSPSQSLLKITAKRWTLRSDRLQWIPSPYLPAASLLELPAETAGPRITYFGRLEGRKGVLELAEALPEVFRRSADARMRFVGAVMPSDVPGVDMRERMQQHLRGWEDRVEFCEPVPREHIPGLLAESDICVFPSRWENFPNTCLEAMAAGQAIVASRAGGMAEMLDEGRCGLLVQPRRPAALSRALLRLLRNPCLQKRLRMAARARVLEAYGPDTIGPRLERSYMAVIQGM